MSKRFSHLWRFMAALCAVIALLSLVSQPAQAANTIVRISKIQKALLGQECQVSISLDNAASPRGFGAFDFLIAYDYPPLTLLEATPGALLDSCGWEYFTYRSGAQGNCNGPCPSGFVRLVAMAETNNGDVHPSCFLSGQSGTLATLTFAIASDQAYACIDFPISFYWTECGENVMSSVTGDTLYLDRKVFEFSNQDDITGQPGYGGWQGIAGSPNCLGTVANTDTVLDFHNGEIETICSDSIDARGDLNLNGIANEVADLVMFTNYFLSGLSAFESGGAVNASVAATDVNADGMTLTYRDLVYLDRIIIGEALPFPKRAVGANVNAYFQQDSTNHSVIVNCNLPLAGAFMLIRGNVTPTYLIPQVGWGTWENYDGTYTRILILGSPEQPYSSGVWLTYHGTGTLEYVETTDWHDTWITAHITYKATDCGNFNGSGGIDISDVVYVIRYIFSGGVAPIDIHGGDVNCDNSCDISDIVYLLTYIFSGGPAPCENCR
jgi:hypothetical protein